MWLWMEASEPGRAGPCVPTATEAVRAPVCVGRGPVIILPLSAGASSATASAWRSPTAPGKLFGDTPAHICKPCLLQKVYEYVCSCLEIERLEKSGGGWKEKIIYSLLPHTEASQIHAPLIVPCCIFAVTYLRLISVDWMVCWGFFFTQSADMEHIVQTFAKAVSRLLTAREDVFLHHRHEPIRMMSISHIDFSFFLVSN